MESAVRGHDPARYQGKNLAFVLLAVCVPAALLYLRLLLGILATSSRVTAVQAARLTLLSNVTLAIFFASQLISARYQQKMLKARATTIGKTLQYAAVLLMGLIFSVTGAIMLEAFGFAVFLRAGPIQ